MTEDSITTPKRSNPQSNTTGLNPMQPTTQPDEPYTLSRPTIRKPAPTTQLTNDRTKQTTLFDTGANDLPGQKRLFDDITGEPIK